MSKTELKERIANGINKLEDKAVLEQLNRFINVELPANGVMHLTEAQKKSISEGIADIEAGNYISHDDANKQIDEWLNK